MQRQESSIFDERRNACVNGMNTKYCITLSCADRTYRLIAEVMWSQPQIKVGADSSGDKLKLDKFDYEQ